MSYPCPECKEPTRVIDCRQHDNGRVRRRECNNKHRFNTIEINAMLDTHGRTVPKDVIPISTAKALLNRSILAIEDIKKETIG